MFINIAITNIRLVGAEAKGLVWPGKWDSKLDYYYGKQIAALRYCHAGVEEHMAQS
jgi:hypothetical protein